MKRVIKYVLLLVVIALVGYKSVYFKKLSTIGVTGAEKFDAVAFANKLWNEQLPPKLDSAIELNTLITAIQSNPEEAFAKYSHAMAIGNYRYSLVKFEGIASVINKDLIMLQVKHADSLLVIELPTELIFGNDIRDASGLVDIRDFSNTTDLNNISEELNKKVRTEVIPPFLGQVRQDATIEVTAAIRFNKEHIDLHQLQILPVRLKVL